MRKSPRLPHCRRSSACRASRSKKPSNSSSSPGTLGTFEDAPVVVNAGRFGPYVLHNKKYASLDKGEDPMSVTLERAIELILAKARG